MSGIASTSASLPAGSATAATGGNAAGAGGRKARGAFTYCQMGRIFQRAWLYPACGH